MSDAYSSIPTTSSAAASAIDVLNRNCIKTVRSSNIATNTNTKSTTPTNKNTNTNTLLALENSPSIDSKRTTACVYFQRGNCRFGSNCRFSHDILGGDVIIDRPSTSTITSTPTSTLLSTSRLSNELASWAEAPPFIPNSLKLVYAQTDLETTAFCEAVAQGMPKICCKPTTWTKSAVGDTSHYAALKRYAEPGSVPQMCPHESPCPYGDSCVYGLHLELCTMCNEYCLHPTDQEQRRLHNQKYLQRHEQAMERSHAIARSRGKMCGICMDIILEKSGKQRRFGILPNCNHIFCLECIRRWRQATDFSHKVIRSCPECRIASDFVCPSPFWVETKEQKDKLLKDYRMALCLKDCKYFKKGHGKCPFGNKCFYKHALPCGKLVDVGLPKCTRKRQRSQSDLTNFFDIYLWEFVDQHDLNFFETIFSSGDLTEIDLEYSDTD